MKSKIIKIIGVFLTITGLPFYSVLADDNEAPESFSCADSVNVMDCIEKTKNTLEPGTVQTVLPATVQQLGGFGPLGFAVRYDQELGWIPEINYLQTFYNNGINLELGYGAKERRANITLGHAFENQQIKFTYEYLAQDLSFDFGSGSVNQWVDQNAFGASYRYIFFEQLLRSINIDGYYIKANNKDLSDVIYYQDNVPIQDLRRIAGGTEETVTGGFTLAPTPQIQINLGGGYSHLVYDTKYESDQNSSTLAYNAGIDFLATPYTKLGGSVANSAAETDGTVKISQILPAHIEADVTGQYSRGQAGQPNSTNVTVGLSYPAPDTFVSIPDGLNSLKDWIRKPVVKAPRVLAIKDEKQIKFTIDPVNPPSQFVMTGQFIQSVSTQNVFHFDPNLYDKVVYSLSMVNGSPQSQLNVDIKPDSNSTYSATIYSTGAMPNSAAPNGAKTVYHVIITALGYKNGLISPIQAQADLELNVNFDNKNEPQWNSTTDKINFDTVDTAYAINLNQKVTQPTPAQPLKFYFDDPNKYPNWDITNSGGVWFLVRRPDSNGFFDASEISTTPAKIVISVQYANDPDDVTIPGQALGITVNPDSKLTLAWQNNASCRISDIMAAQPTNSQMFYLKLTPCTLYKNAGNFIKIKNDALNYSIGSNGNYPASLSISGSNDNSQLNITGPTSGLNNSYSIGLHVKSKAQGGDSPGDLDLTAQNAINVGSYLMVTTQTLSPQNIYKFSEAGSFITSIVVNNLSDNQSYYLNSSIPIDPSNTNTMETPGAVTNQTTYDNSKNTITLYPNPVHASKGQISIMWYSVNNYPQISSLIIRATPQSQSR